jgi:hypothetical protein
MHIVPFPKGQASMRERGKIIAFPNAPPINTRKQNLSDDLADLEGAAPTCPSVDYHPLAKSASPLKEALDNLDTIRRAHLRMTLMEAVQNIIADGIDPAQARSWVEVAIANANYRGSR